MSRLCVTDEYWIDEQELINNIRYSLTSKQRRAEKEVEKALGNLNRINHKLQQLEERQDELTKKQ